ncbi:MAG: hypothetical protein DRI24_24065 [Deltaproteobacteria bacterium]|nr:MAG: hypothetical protein DRI24_24065 [Deltaproteobacteria bacterium]
MKRRTSLDRLLPLAGSLFTAITNESRVIEADKVFQTRDRFQIRSMIREELAVTLTTDPEPSSLSGLMEKLGGLLELDGNQEMIPTGASSLAGEIRRVIVEEGNQGSPLETLRKKTTEEILAFSTDPGSSPPEEWGAWLRALNYVAVDRVMKLEGKLERSQLVAISPATDPTDPGQMHELPGHMINGFGGFMSELAGEHEVEVARYCTQLFLQAAHRIREERLPKLPDFSRNRPRFLRDLREGLEAVENRLVELLADSHMDLVGRLPIGVLRYFVQGKLTRLAKEESPSESCELRLQVPNMNYEFDGGGLADTDLKPRKIAGKYYLITYGTYRRDENKPWTGPHILGKKQIMRVDRDRKGVRSDKGFCRVDLPAKGLVTKGRSLPHPIWVARIKGSDEGERVGSSRWKLINGVEGLDRNLLG